MVRVGGFFRIALMCFAVLTGALASAQAEPGMKIPPHRTASAPPPETSFSSPARFFSIKEVLAKVDAAKASGTPVERFDWPLRLASLGGSDLPSTSTAEPAPQGDEPFGLLTFRAPEGT